MTAIRQSHIDANVPDPKDFDSLLKRDLTKYVTDSGDKDVTVTVELLRNGPTQSGIAFPKFYLWVAKLNAKGEIVEEAAARVAAVEKKRFDVIQYFPKARIIAEPDLMKTVFPGDVYEKIRARIKPEEK